MPWGSVNNQEILVEQIYNMHIFITDENCMNCNEDKTSYLQFEAILMVGNPAHSST